MSLHDCLFKKDYETAEKLIKEGEKCGNPRIFLDIALEDGDEDGVKFILKHFPKTSHSRYAADMSRINGHHKLLFHAEIFDSEEINKNVNYATVHRSFDKSTNLWMWNDCIPKSWRF